MEEPEEIAALTVDVVANRIPRKFGLNPRRDVQVLAPMHRGAAGAGNLNNALQEALTPSREGMPERRYGGRVFRVGDKVTQLRNNYDKGAAGVFNGTVGLVVDIKPDEHKLTVLTDEDENVEYAFDELDELAHAYAVSIHRSQGSEYPAVVIPLTTSAWMMLQRNLLYTAITRAKKLVVIVGSRRALAQAVRTRGAGRRHTSLTHRLQSRRPTIDPAQHQSGRRSSRTLPSRRHVSGLISSATREPEPRPKVRFCRCADACQGACRSAERNPRPAALCCLDDPWPRLKPPSAVQTVRRIGPASARRSRRGQGRRLLQLGSPDQMNGGQQIDGLLLFIGHPVSTSYPTNLIEYSPFLPTEGGALQKRDQLPYRAPRKMG